MQLPKAELYIMEQFWQYGPMTSEEVQKRVTEKNWKRTTLLTFLGRLIKKGMLAADKSKMAFLYSPAISQDAYAMSIGKRLLETQFGGSLKNFMSAMVSEKHLSKKELDEVKAWLEQQDVEAADD